MCVQEKVDGGSSLLREDPSSHEQLQAWLRHRQVQQILQLGDLFHFLLSFTINIESYCLHITKLTISAYFFAQSVCIDMGI